MGKGDESENNENNKKTEERNQVASSTMISNEQSEIPTASMGVTEIGPLFLLSACDGNDLKQPIGMTFGFIQLPQAHVSSSRTDLLGRQRRVHLERFAQVQFDCAVR